MLTLREIFEAYPPGLHANCPLGAVSLVLNRYGDRYPSVADASLAVMAWLYPDRSFRIGDAPFNIDVLDDLLETVMMKWDRAESSRPWERQARMRRACLRLAKGLKDLGFADRVGDITEASLIEILGHEVEN